MSSSFFRSSIRPVSLGRQFSRPNKKKIVTKYSTPNFDGGTVFSVKDSGAAVKNRATTTTTQGVYRVFTPCSGRWCSVFHRENRPKIQANGAKYFRVHNHTTYAHHQQQSIPYCGAGSSSCCVRSSYQRNCCAIVDHPTELNRSVWDWCTRCEVLLLELSRE